MARIFYPKHSVYVPASAPHPENTKYKVSVGEEDWEGVFQTVAKVQMLYNDKVAGRKSPSYPIDSDDTKKVAEAMEKLMVSYSKEQKVVHIPAKPFKVVPINQYVELLCQVPVGKITRWEDIEHYLKKAYGFENIRPNDLYWPQETGDGMEIPYWRVVGSYGYLFQDMRCSRDKQYKQLVSEGLQIEPCGTEQKSLRVVDYKHLLFDFNNIGFDITAVPNTDKRIEECLTDALMDINKIKTLPSFLLETLIKNSLSTTNERETIAAQNANAELERRRTTVTNVY